MKKKKKTKEEEIECALDSLQVLGLLFESLPFVACMCAKDSEFEMQNRFRGSSDCEAGERADNCIHGKRSPVPRDRSCDEWNWRWWRIAISNCDCDCD